MLQTCEKHSGCVVVFDDYRYGAGCPVCTEIEALEVERDVLKEKVEDLEEKAESLQSEIDEAKED